MEYPIQNVPPGADLLHPAFDRSPESEAAPVAKAAKKTNVFDNDYVSALCRQYQQEPSFHLYEKIVAASNNLLDSVIRYHKFHVVAPFQDIKNSMYLQFRNWIAGWEPDGKPLFGYFSACSRNAALSYITSEKKLASRLMYEHNHQTPLDAFAGMSYTPNFDFELRETMREKLRDIEIRWHEPVIKEVVRYMISTIISNRAVERRQQIIRTTVMAYPITDKDAKFLLDWSQGAVRHALLEHYHVPLGEIDVMRAADKYSFLPDIVNVIGLEHAKMLMAVFAGRTIKFPSPTQVRRYATLKIIYEEMEKDPTPSTVRKLAGQLRISTDRVQQSFEDTCENIQGGVLEDHPLFDDEEPTIDLLDEAAHG